MKISELIKELEQIMDKEGGIDAYVREYMDELGYPEGGEDPRLTVEEKEYMVAGRSKEVVHVKELVL